MFEKNDIDRMLDILEEMYPDAKCALDHENVFQLTVAVVLSAQTTDRSVNTVTPALFKAYPTPEALAAADAADVENLIKRIGMYRTKAKNIIGLAKALTEEHGGEVPKSYDELIKLPGVGRKTANVVLSVGFGEQRIAVDTHVFRVSNRIGLVHENNVLDTELGLLKVIPNERLSRTHHSLIFHGRNCCTAKNPKCGECGIKSMCEYFRDKNK